MAGDPPPPRRITPFEPPSFAGGARFPLDDAAIVARVHDALDEDRAFDDVTTIATIHSGRHQRALLVAREPGVVAGVPLALAAFRLLDERVEIRVDAEDGTAVARGATVLFISGHARGILSAERVALNFLQRLSGIATLTRRYVDAVRGTRAAILDTRKTTPGWRRLEKYAVHCGGGVNHRMDLASAVLIKDNHLAAVDGDVAAAVRRVREYATRRLAVQVECDTPAQVRAAVEAGADSVLLDNMSLDQLRDSVAIAAGRCVTEASGGVTLSTVRAIAETGVDRISVGALTHSPRALDLGLDFE
ncbi:MAG: carboxylating nicotinate-nucleotide diphosphorylase [Gemmatimonadetes bacterium]|nr:carboxylating nicotinate-nucleotide diphosphorylase [Gemmatimonadota bacterium]MBI3569429.1 carboxylating nicotinate-nucleotide diphosphorylase [Gemmatimonadota bacterium]